MSFFVFFVYSCRATSKISGNCTDGKFGLEVEEDIDAVGWDEVGRKIAVVGELKGRVVHVHAASIRSPSQDSWKK
jgi:hypothetical protein